MGAIDIYLKEISRRYPATQAVREQIEELRDTLHLKTEELQAQGRPYELAEQASIDSLGDVSPLLEEVAGDARTVYVNRLKLKSSLLMFHLFIAEYIIIWQIMLFSWHSWTNIVHLQLLWFVMFIIAAGVWPISAALKCKRDPEKTTTVSMEYKKRKRIALIVWLMVSAVSFTYCFLSANNFTIFLFFSIAAADWPLSLYIYHRKLTGGRYDARGI